jgi:hypothetical protein
MSDYLLPFIFLFPIIIAPDLPPFLPDFTGDIIPAPLPGRPDFIKSIATIHLHFFY